MMPSSRWLQLSYVCGSYDKVFLPALLCWNAAAELTHGDDERRVGPSTHGQVVDQGPPGLVGRREQDVLEPVNVSVQNVIPIRPNPL